MRKGKLPLPPGEGWGEGIMFETSKDILWITLAGSVGLFTLFACWGIFYMIMIIRAASKSVKKVEQVIENINEVIKTTKEKIEHSAAYFSILGEGFKKVMEIAKDNGIVEKKKKKKKK